MDVATWTVVRTLEGGPGPEHLVFSQDERTIYVANPRAGVVTAVDVASGKPVRIFQIGKDAHGLDISDDRTTLYATARGDNKLVAIDVASGEERTLHLSPAPYHLNAIRGAGKVYVSSARAPTIWVIDQKTFTLKGTIQLPAGEGHQMAVVQ